METCGPYSHEEISREINRKRPEFEYLIDSVAITDSEVKFEILDSLQGKIAVVSINPTLENTTIKSSSCGNVMELKLARMEGGNYPFKQLMNYVYAMSYITMRD